MKLKYIVTETIYHNGELTRKAFGIAAVTEEDGFTLVIDSVCDISSSFEKMKEAVELCNTLGLSPVHLHDMAEEFA